MLFFPSNMVLAPGGSLTISSGKHIEVSEMLWANKDAWSGKKDSAVSLYDSWGNLVSTAP
jgi:hypothetical protein